VWCNRKKDVYNALVYEALSGEGRSSIWLITNPIVLAKTPSGPSQRFHEPQSLDGRFSAVSTAVGFLSMTVNTVRAGASGVPRPPNA
jgi:hypothetical protein